MAPFFRLLLIFRGVERSPVRIWFFFWEPPQVFFLSDSSGGNFLAFATRPKFFPQIICFSWVFGGGPQPYNSEPRLGLQPYPSHFFFAPLGDPGCYSEVFPSSLGKWRLFDPLFCRPSCTEPTVKSFVGACPPPPSEQLTNYPLRAFFATE